MDTIVGTRFRRDTFVMKTLKPGGDLQLLFVVKDLKSNQLFEFDEKEHFLSQAWNGEATFSQITTAFQERFHQRLDERDLEQFICDLGELGLLETCNHRVAVLTSRTPTPKKQKLKFVFSLKTPDLLFRKLTVLSNQFQWLWIALVIATIPGVPIALLTLMHNWSAFQYDLTRLYSNKQFFALISIHFVFLGASLLTRIVQGIVLTSSGGKVRNLGCTLVIGFVPHISIEMDGLQHLDRQKQLWIYGSSLVARLIQMVVSILLWFSVRVSDTFLPDFTLLLILACSISVLLDGSPLWLSDGYSWMVIYFRLPHLLYKSRLFWTMLLQRRPLPPYITQREGLLLSVFGLTAAIITGLMVIVFMNLFSSNISEILLGILSINAAYGITLGLIVVLFARFLWISLVSES